MSAAAAQQAPTILDQARACVARGWRVFPVAYRGKRPAVGIHWPTATASTPADRQLEHWFGRAPVNLGIGCKGSRLVIIDDDSGDDSGMARLCAAYGHPVPETYRVRTRPGRRHWFFTAPDDVEIGCGSGFLKTEYSIDVKGTKGGDEKNAGGYVVGPGSVHETGIVYTPEDPDADAVDLPWWLVELLLAVQAKDDGPTKEQPAAEPRADRRFTDDQADAYIKTQVDKLRAQTPGSENRNNTLNATALLMGHFVPEFCDEHEVVEQLHKIARRIGLDESEILPTIRSGLRAGMAEPYTRVDPTSPTADESDGAVGDDAELAPEEVYARDLALRVRNKRLDRDADLVLRRELHAHRPRIADGVLDDLDAIPEPEMLLGSLIPEDGIGFLAGRSGAYKSFLATSWACCIATGQAWLGRAEFAVRRPLRTLYVAAEGAGGAAGRIRAWEKANGVSRRGKLQLYPRAIHLNDQTQVDELVEYVAEQGYQFLVVDTYHRSAPGTEENSSTEFGVVFEAVARLRDDHGCAVLFVDHTGNGKTGNPRGTSGKRDDSDYVLSTSYAGEEATAQAQRELFVTKLKDEDTTGRWPIRLEPVPGERFPVIEIGQVAASEADPFGASFDDWNDPMQAELPTDVVNYTGHGAKAIRALARFMRARATGGVGFTQAAARKAVLTKFVDEKGKAKFSPDSVDRAWGALVDLGRIEPAEGAGATGRSLWIAQNGDPK